MATARQKLATENVSYTDLYSRWERGNWRATEIDFTRDPDDWRQLSEEQRRAALWLWSAIFSAEDAVTDNITPYIDAMPLEEQKYFLATHQVDEARHTVMFHRFYSEVAGFGEGGAIASTLAAADGYLNWGYRKVFARLDSMADELRRDRSLEKLAEAVTLYFVIGESGLGQPSQLAVVDYLTDADVLPGIREGFERISNDEHRHIAFGVKFLSDLYHEHGEPIQDAIVRVLREVLAWVAMVPIPPNWDMSYYEAWGVSLEEFGERGAASMERAMRAIGLPLEEIPGFPLAVDISPRERFCQGIEMARANMIGPGGPVSHDPELIALLFDLTRRRIDTRRLPADTTIQWDFADVDPWHIHVDNGATAAVPGRVARPDLTLRCRFDDWVDLTAERVTPARLLGGRRLRPRGKLWLLPSFARAVG